MWDGCFLSKKQRMCISIEELMRKKHCLEERSQNWMKKWQCKNNHFELLYRNVGKKKYLRLTYLATHLHDWISESLTALVDEITHAYSRAVTVHQRCRRHGDRGGSCPRCPNGAGAARGQQVALFDKNLYLLFI